VPISFMETPNRVFKVLNILQLISILFLIWRGHPFTPVLLWIGDGLEGDTPSPRLEMDWRWIFKGIVKVLILSHLTP
jgi:hypothetical protein